MRTPTPSSPSPPCPCANDPLLLLYDLLKNVCDCVMCMLMCVCVCVYVSINTGTWEVANVHSKHKMLRSGVYWNLAVPQQTATLTYVP